MSLEQRVGHLEQETAKLHVKVEHIEATVDRTASGVDQLLSMQAAKPDALTWRVVVATLLSALALISGMSAGTWWLIEHSPSVIQIDRRLTKLDDPELGRVPRLEEGVRKLTGWEPRVHRPRP